MKSPFEKSEGGFFLLAVLLVVLIVVLLVILLVVLIVVLSVILIVVLVVVLLAVLLIVFHEWFLQNVVLRLTAELVSPQTRFLCKEF